MALCIGRSWRGLYESKHTPQMSELRNKCCVSELELILGLSRIGYGLLRK
jgi:hypothetical protein